MSIADFTPNYAGTVPFTKDFIHHIPVTMSLIPYLSNELSPWPRIHLGEVHSKATAVQPTTFPRLHRGSSQQTGSTPSSTKPRGRASSYAGPLPAKSQIRDRSTSFGSTQEYEDVYGSGPVQRLDRKASDRKVQELLKLRNQRLKEAKRKGDEVEVSRLKKLTLFDDIERPRTETDKPREVEFSGDSTELPDHHGFTSQTDVFGFGFTPRPKAVNQGHTPTLCWHLKLECTQGLTVPEEFSQCEIHSIPIPGASSISSLTLLPASPSSLSSRSGYSSRHVKVSSTGSSTLRDFSEPSSPAKLSLKATASEPSSSTKDSSIVPNPDEEDPFLYIAKYIIQRHAKRGRQAKEVKRLIPQTSSVDASRSSHYQCTCTNHNDRIYLSGPPSKHCRFCKLPRPQPEIAAAVLRIEEMKTSVLAAQVDTNFPAETSSEAADEVRKFEALQEDMKLVEMYNAETEKRCRNGIWWEGRLIVEDLKKQGIVGSKPFGI